MPVYEYRCVSCGRAVEVIHGVHDQGPAACDACGGEMRKALSAPAIHFKGSGWAKVDARAAASRSGGAPSSEAPTTTSDGGAAATPPASGSSTSDSTSASVTTGADD